MNLQNVAHQLKACGMNCTLHWWPSHIENTLARKRFTENHYADKLANEGQARSTESDEKLKFERIQERILSAVISLVESIDKKLELLINPPDVPPVNADDLSACADDNRDHGFKIP